MSGLSPYGVSQLLPASLGGPAPVKPASLYFAPLVELAEQTDTGSTISEPVFAGYARTPVAFSVWGPLDGANIANASPIALPTPPSGQVQVLNGVLVDAPTGGNIWWFVDTFAMLLDAEDAGAAAGDEE
jgi:hypothetical protein